MSNRTVPAAAEGLPKLTRRQALRTLAAGGATGALAAGVIVATVPAEATIADPMLAAVEEYEAAYALQGEMVEREDWANCDAIYSARISPAEDAIGSGLPATTLAGAVGAIRYVASQTDWLDEAHVAALRSALAYFNGRA